MIFSDEVAVESAAQHVSEFVLGCTTAWPSPRQCICSTVKLAFKDPSVSMAVCCSEVVEPSGAGNAFSLLGQNSAKIKEFARSFAKFWCMLLGHCKSAVFSGSSSERLGPCLLNTFLGMAFVMEFRVSCRHHGGEVTSKREALSGLAL